ncbi:MAG: LysR family transcriptional regulator [Bacillus sp. (in: firmicutes)]
MNFSEYQLLSVLAQEMNMRKAAERLFVSQPALSQRLQTIEKDWNTQIFIRSQKGLMLTPAGEAVVKLADSILEQELRVREELQAMDSRVFGTLKIACATIVGQHWLPKVLKKYVNLYPHAKISLVTGWSSDTLKALYDDTVHVGIIRGTPDWKGVRHHLFKDRLYLVDTETDDIARLLDTDRPFIQFKSDSNYFQEIQDWWMRRYQKVPKRTIVVDQIETCKQMALNGIGYAILPGITFHHHESDIYKVPLLDEKNEHLERDTWLLGYEKSFQLQQVNAFVEVVREYMKETVDE